MADFNNIISGAADDDMDAYWISVLAQRLVDRIPQLCKLRTFYDGQEIIPTSMIPDGTSDNSTVIYERFREMGAVNYARIIVNSISSRQKPIGFRMVGENSARNTDADTAWFDNRMDLKARQMMHDVALYGSGYLMVTDSIAPNRVDVLSPWTTAVSDDGDSAVIYSYDAFNGVEQFSLYRAERDDDGTVSNIQVRHATRATNGRSIMSESDSTEIYKLCNDPQATIPTIPTDFSWDSEGDGKDTDFAKNCNSIPVVRVGSGDGMGQFEPHLRILMSLDQERFDRFCVQVMQAFRQRAVKGKIPTVYVDGDPEVVAGTKKVGDHIDYSDTFSLGPGMLWTLPEGAEIWESAVTDITPWVTAATNDVKQLAAATGLPLDILSPDVQGSASGADLKREGLIFNVTDLNARANDGFVLAMRMAMVANGDSSAVDQRFETVWAPIMHDSDLNTAQAANYVQEILPAKTIMRKYLHMTETEIAEAMQDMNDASFTAQVTTNQAQAESQSTGFDESASTGDNAVLVDVEE
ncbi:hypothetical protein [Bifidobacterium cuniculi]|uniref:Phage protein n=1 Tax=Bifidobacterium cuniculi TaxID=1688 RepID=A0A087AFH6_9BIFI|nr:hypothetical protein [Bifidobacterium cuniculi]KFI57526.1 phage protein [Bifidobacterium cuniculi]